MAMRLRVFFRDLFLCSLSVNRFLLYDPASELVNVQFFVVKHERRGREDYSGMAAMTAAAMKILTRAISKKKTQPRCIS